MLYHSKKFKSHHKIIRGLLNKLTVVTLRDNPNKATIEAILKQLIEEKFAHFIYKENLIKLYRFNQKYINLHKMEHRSFLYHIEKWCCYFSQKNYPLDLTENLIQSINVWITYYVIKSDQVLETQIRLKTIQYSYHQSIKSLATETSLDPVVAAKHRVKKIEWAYQVYQFCEESKTNISATHLLAQWQHKKSFPDKTLKKSLFAKSLISINFSSRITLLI